MKPSHWYRHAGVLFLLPIAIIADWGVPSPWAWVRGALWGVGVTLFVVSVILHAKEPRL